MKLAMALISAHLIMLFTIPNTKTQVNKETMDEILRRLLGGTTQKPTSQSSTVRTLLGHGETGTTTAQRTIGFRATGRPNTSNQQTSISSTIILINDMDGNTSTGTTEDMFKKIIDLLNNRKTTTPLTTASTTSYKITTKDTLLEILNRLKNKTYTVLPAKNTTNFTIKSTTDQYKNIIDGLKNQSLEHTITTTEQTTKINIDDILKLLNNGTFTTKRINTNSTYTRRIMLSTVPNSMTSQSDVNIKPSKTTKIYDTSHVLSSPNCYDTFLALETIAASSSDRLFYSTSQQENSLYDTLIINKPYSNSVINTESKLETKTVINNFISIYDATKESDARFILSTPVTTSIDLFTSSFMESFFSDDYSYTTSAVVQHINTSTKITPTPTFISIYNSTTKSDAGFILSTPATTSIDLFASSFIKSFSSDKYSYTSSTVVQRTKTSTKNTPSPTLNQSTVDALFKTLSTKYITPDYTSTPSVFRSTADVLVKSSPTKYITNIIDSTEQSYVTVRSSELESYTFTITKSLTGLNVSESTNYTYSLTTSAISSLSKQPLYSNITPSTTLQTAHQSAHSVVTPSVKNYLSTKKTQIRQTTTSGNNDKRRQETECVGVIVIVTYLWTIHFVGYL